VAPKDTAAKLPEDKPEGVKPETIPVPQPGPESQVQAERLHEQIEDLKSGKPRGGPPSPREFIDRRMREIEDDEKDPS
jgi:hypothetical protein